MSDDTDQADHQQPEPPVCDLTFVGPDGEAIDISGTSDDERLYLASLAMIAVEEDLSVSPSFLRRVADNRAEVAVQQRLASLERMVMALVGHIKGDQSTTPAGLVVPPGVKGPREVE